MCDCKHHTWWDRIFLTIVAALGISALVVLFWPGGFDVIDKMHEHRATERIEQIRTHDSPTYQLPSSASEVDALRAFSELDDRFQSILRGDAPTGHITIVRQVQPLPNRYVLEVDDSDEQTGMWHRRTVTIPKEEVGRPGR